MTQKEFNNELDSFAETIISTLSKDKLNNAGLCMALMAAKAQHLFEAHLKETKK